MPMEWFLEREFGWFFYPNGDEVRFKVAEALDMIGIKMPE